MECLELFEKIDELNEKYIKIWEDVCNIESPTNFKRGVDAVGEYFIKLAREHIQAESVEDGESPTLIHEIIKYVSDNFLENRGIDSSTVTLNSIVVESALRNRYIDSSDLFYYYVENVGKVSQNEAQLYLCDDEPWR